MKSIIGRAYRKEGRHGERLHSVIQCSVCKALTYERKSDKIQAALNRDCMNCKSLRAKAKKIGDRLQSQQDHDHGLLAMLRSIQRLLPTLDRRTKHGLCAGSNKRTYGIWKNMMYRCYCYSSRCYQYYGGRGIRVCERWHDVANFFADMGVAPDGYSLERNDVDGDYELLNCSWIPIDEQSRNRRMSYSNRGITDAGEYQRRKRQLIADGVVNVSKIPFANKKVGWWRAFGLYHNPYLYGPMPYRMNSRRFRRAEAIAVGLFVPRVS